MCFLRSKNLRLNRRRYELTLDSWFLVRQAYHPLTDENNNHEHEIMSNETTISYIISDAYITTGRPHTPRLEIEMQITFRFSQLPDRRQMHSIHILSALQLVGYLVQNGSTDPYYGYNPLQEDLPLIRYRSKNLRHFNGPTILHFVFCQIYQTLVHINPSGNSS